MGDDESNTLARFMEITGSDLQTAVFALEASASNLENAVNLHMSGSMGGMGGGGGELAAEPSSEFRNAGIKRGASGGSYYDGDLDEEEGVRKADEVKRQRLLNASPTGYLRHDASLPSNVKESVFFASSDGNLTGKAKELNNLFAPPRDLMVAQPLHAAQKMCGEEKWLLVNIQRVDEFNCLTLNRDVWADETVKEVLRSSFLFWQQMHTDFDASNHLHRKTDAQDFVQKYHVKVFPHLSILDPRTGAMIWKWDEQKSSKQRKSGDTSVKKEHLLERLMDFVGEHPNPKAFTGMKLASTKNGGASKSSESLLSQETLIKGVSVTSSTSDASSVTAPSFSESRSSSTSSSTSGSKYGKLSQGAESVPGSDQEGISTADVQDPTDSINLQSNVKGQGYHIFSSLRYKNGADALDETRFTAGGPIRVKLQLPLAAATLSLAVDTTALELVMFVAKRLRDIARAASASSGADDGDTRPSSLQLEPRFELSFGMPVVRMSEIVGQNEQELDQTTLSSLGLKSGDLVRLQKLKPL